MRRHRQVLSCLVLVWGLVCAFGTSALGRQDWRGEAVASFDLVWQTIADSHYDPDDIRADWVAARAELRPRAEEAAAPGELRKVIRDLLGRLRQSHFRLITGAVESDSLLGPATVPIDLRVTSGAVFVTRVASGAPAGRLDIRPGDQLVAIDDLGVGDLAAGIGTEEATPRMREVTLWRRIMRQVSGAVSSTVELTLRRPGGGERKVQVTRVLEPGDLVTVGNLPPMRTRIDVEEARTEAGARVGVIGFNIWMPAIAEPFALAIDRFRDADGLVIDLRGNPGGLADMMRGIAGHLMDEPRLLGRMRMRTATLEFRANPRRSMADGRRVEPFDGPVAILVDGLSASASECFAGALQSMGRARVFGTQTMGQALPASTVRLPNGDVLMYAVGDFVTSTGRRLEGDGVMPDELVPITAESLAAGRDARQAALAWLNDRPSASTGGPSASVR